MKRSKSTSPAESPIRLCTKGSIELSLPLSPPVISEIALASLHFEGDFVLVAHHVVALRFAAGQHLGDDLGHGIGVRADGGTARNAAQRPHTALDHLWAFPRKQ